MDNINIIIGNNLNTYRKSKGYSLDKVADMTGVSKGMLGQIERGETNPSISTLWKIAKKFGSTVDEIVKVNGIENPDVIMPGEQLFIPR